MSALMGRSLWELLRGKTVPKATRKFGGYFHNDAEHRDFTAIGTAAGIALKTLCSHCMLLVSFEHQICLLCTRLIGTVCWFSILCQKLDMD